MYTSPSGLILGFHGCDKKIADKVLSGNMRLNLSTNSYDWLGNGIYFWENNPDRALEYAKILMKYPERVKVPIQEPAVIGVVLNLGNCIRMQALRRKIIFRYVLEILIVSRVISEYLNL